MTIGVLAVQGAFAEHIKRLKELGIDSVELRKKDDLGKPFDGIILPGGESTVQGKLLKELDMFDTLKNMIKNEVPVLATCAGLILLAEKLENDSHTYFGTLPVTVKRNAYGRQLGSFFTEEDFKGIGKIPMTFIRAPYIESSSDDVDILAKENNHTIAVRYKNQLAMSFHPELDNDTRIHEYFVDMIKGCQIILPSFSFVANGHFPYNKTHAIPNNIHASVRLNNKYAGSVPLIICPAKFQKQLLPFIKAFTFIREEMPYRDRNRRRNYICNKCLLIGLSDFKYLNTTKPGGV